MRGSLPSICLAFHFARSVDDMLGTNVPATPESDWYIPLCSSAERSFFGLLKSRTMLSLPDTVAHDAAALAMPELIHFTDFLLACFTPEHVLDLRNVHAVGRFVHAPDFVGSLILPHDELLHEMDAHVLSF